MGTTIKVGRFRVDDDAVRQAKMMMGLSGTGWTVPFAELAGWWAAWTCDNTKVWQVIRFETTDGRTYAEQRDAVALIAALDQRAGDKRRTDTDERHGAMADEPRAWKHS